MSESTRENVVGNRPAISLPYEDHPEFQFDVGRLSTRPDTVAAFNDAYARMASGEPDNSVARALATVFADLRPQVTDSDALAFLVELEAKCERLLADDLRHFRGRHRDASQLDVTFERDKFVSGTLSRDCVSGLQKVAAASISTFRARAADGKLTREDLSVNQGTVPRDLVRILNPEFRRLGLNDLVSAYAGKRMEVAGLALELSVATASWWRNRYQLTRPPHTLYAHTDEGLDVPKAIVYLSDVDDTTGPFSVYPQAIDQLGITPLQSLVGRIVGGVGTDPSSTLYALYQKAYHQGFSSEPFRRHFAMLPRELKYNSHFGWDVVPDSALEQTLVRVEHKFRGPAGTFIVFDGARLLHRGGMVGRGERIALQVVFAEPRSLREKVATRLARARADVDHARTRVANEARDLRRRIGRTAIQYSPAPAERLSRMLASLLPPVVCVDIGASYYPHGPWEVFRRSPQTLWIAVEPNAQNTGYLNDWHWPAKTRLEAIGLSEHGGEQTLHVTNVDSGSSLLPPVISPNMEHRVGEDGRTYFFPVTTKRIPTRSLVEVVADTGTTPLIVKLDTQGTELSILRGAQSLFDAHRIVGIETEATMLAEPYMAGSGKFWEVCEFLEARGFELLQLKPIEPAPKKKRKVAGRTYLNECDAVFALRHDVVAQLSEAHRLALVGFYASYHLYEELEAMLDKIPGLEASCARAGFSVAALRKLLD